ncbi:MAG: hypothetical protein H6845_00480 [Alphaproteobacteria bacterium]|nr:MAG: hypothetical protein H6845_00480 [Alphaproteobacteria bacterium]
MSSSSVLPKRYLSKLVAVRGRPKAAVCGPTLNMIEKKVAAGVSDINMPINLLSTYYSLKKISDEEYEAARFYEEIAYNAFKYSDTSPLANSSFMMNISNGSSIKNYNSLKDNKNMKVWMRVRSLLCEFSQEAEQLIFDLLIKNKAPVRKDFLILKKGLQVIYSYYSSNRQ